MYFFFSIMNFMTRLCKVLELSCVFFFFQAEDGIRDCVRCWSSDVCSSDLYVDLLWLHMRDEATPIEEAVRALDDQVRLGKVLYVGISDSAAWVVAQANTIAELRGW